LTIQQARQQIRFQLEQLISKKIPLILINMDHMFFMTD
jgi:hypothetical protein